MATVNVRKTDPIYTFTLSHAEAVLLGAILGNFTGTGLRKHLKEHDGTLAKEALKVLDEGENIDPLYDIYNPLAEALEG